MGKHGDKKRGKKWRLFPGTKEAWNHGCKCIPIRRSLEHGGISFRIFTACPIHSLMRNFIAGKEVKRKNWDAFCHFYEKYIKKQDGIRRFWING